MFISHFYMLTSYLKKKIKKRRQPEFRSKILHIFFSFDFEPVLVFLSRFLTFCFVFSAWTSATSCRDAEFVVWLTYTYRVFRKNCVFFTIHCTPPSPTSLSEAFKALNAMKVYSHSYWLVIFFNSQ